ncbi:MAG: hypothetical protein Q7V58_16350 [Actinomycetota bacterium]|nr:hypothetical protein [Actinomycetota bacterium]
MSTEPDDTSASDKLRALWGEDLYERLTVTRSIVERIDGDDPLPYDTLLSQVVGGLAIVESRVLQLEDTIRGLQAE